MNFDHLVASLTKAKPDTLEGRVFGRLTVLNNIPCFDKWGSMKIHCRCSCGNYTLTRKYMLLHGVTESCGCIRKEHARALNAKAREAAMKSGNLRAPNGRYLRKTKVPNRSSEDCAKSSCRQRYPDAAEEIRGYDAPTWIGFVETTPEYVGHKHTRETDLPHPPVLR